MAISLQNMALFGAGGLVVGTVYYLYSTNKLGFNLDDILGGGGGVEEPPKCDKIAACEAGFTWSDDECKCVPVTGGGEAPGQVGGQYAYFQKRKIQCRDNHLTAAWLQAQGIRLVNYKLYTDNTVYPQVCGTPSSTLILAAVKLEDTSSQGSLKGLGFTEYAGGQLDPNIIIPNPSEPSPPPAGPFQQIARYIRITVNGNTVNNASSINEIQVFGGSNCSRIKEVLTTGSSGSETDNPPWKATDDNFATRWANPNKGSWIQLDMGNAQPLCAIDVTWFSRSTETSRKYHFKISISKDNITWKDVVSRDSNGTKTAERYNIPTTATSNLAIAYVGSAGPHSAYKVYRRF